MLDGEDVEESGEKHVLIVKGLCHYSWLCMCGIFNFLSSDSSIKFHQMIIDPSGYQILLMQQFILKKVVLLNRQEENVKICMRAT